MRLLELRLANTPGDSRVTVEGVELAGMVRSVRVDATAGDRPRVILELVVDVAATMDEGAVAYIAHLGPLGGSGVSRVEALERLTEAVRQEDGA